MKFIDETEIEVQAGDGGNGCVAFRRERFRPRGGPSGGNGGRGGDVIVAAAGNLATLLELRYRPRWKAGRGAHGQGNDRHGRAGHDVVIRVPEGTVITDASTGALVADLDRDGSRVTVAKGGRGGRGNLSFKSSTRRAPDFAEQGAAGEHRRLHLELKLLADVGVVGFPNVGKSTLIRRVSAARPRVADYPFTTLVPTLGVVRLDDERQFVIADLPGLVPGASEGVGLGFRFLRHVERTRVLVHLVTARDEPGSDPVADLRAIDEELERYSPELARRPAIVALNKVDLTHVRRLAPELSASLAGAGRGPVIPVSATTGEGVGDLLEAIHARLSQARAAISPPPSRPRP